MTSKTYTFHSDSAHAWLEVPLGDLCRSGVADQITNYSYRKGDAVYLEEDCDASRFLQALRHQGIQVNFREAYIGGEHHWIRNLNHWEGRVAQQC